MSADVGQSFVTGIKLGEGTYGRVHECVLECGKVCAVKMLKRSDDGIKNPLEMSIMAAYMHSNLNSSITISYDSYHIYIIQEKSECDLKAYLLSNLPYDRVSWYCQLLQGLACLHEENIIHCDIKPGNILVTENQTLKLTDYSHSILISKKEKEFTCDVGSPCYCAPEVMEHIPWGKKIDMWSLGCVFFELSTGKMMKITERKYKSLEDRLSRVCSSFSNTTFASELDKRMILGKMLVEYKSRHTPTRILRDEFPSWKLDEYDMIVIEGEKGINVADYLKKITKDREVIRLAVSIFNKVGSIKHSLVKIETCFVLASKILRGDGKFKATLSPKNEILDMEMEVCRACSFIIHY